MRYYTYILKSLKDNGFYIGMTANLQRRLNYHNLGTNPSTKSRIPFILAYSEEFTEKKSALKRERQIKSYKGGEAFKRLLMGGL